MHFFHLDDCDCPGIFRADATDASPRNDGPIRATDFGSGSAANTSGSGSTID
jgi:hypothetical protein